MVDCFLAWVNCPFAVQIQCTHTKSIITNTLSFLWSWIGLPDKNRNRATVSTSFVLSRWIDLWHNPSRPPPHVWDIRTGNVNELFGPISSAPLTAVRFGPARLFRQPPTLISRLTHSLPCSASRRAGGTLATPSASLWVPLKFKISRMECRVA